MDRSKYLLISSSIFGLVAAPHLCGKAVPEPAERHEELYGS